jgi:predicted nucleic acid-binding protein
VLIYAVAADDVRSEKAEALLADGGALSVQVLNGFVAVGRRKLDMPWADLIEALAAIRVLCPSPLPLTLETHASAIRIAQRYGYRIYDALVATSAIEANCDTLYSEDLQDGQVIEDRLTIRNPFKR